LLTTRENIVDLVILDATTLPDAATNPKLDIEPLTAPILAQERVVEPPEAIVLGDAVKLVIVGLGTTVTVVLAVTDAPAELVTVRVNVVVSVKDLAITPDADTGPTP
jgi:hypothetical protein